jgi:hypothetical protein
MTPGAGEGDLRRAVGEVAERRGKGGGPGSDAGSGAAPGRRPEDAAQLAELPLHPGLCARCRHLRLLRGRRSTFVRCALAETDPAFARYPPLPVVRCEGFEEE